MEITEDKLFRAEILKRIAEREFREREGVHSSDLIFCLNKQALRKMNPVDPTDNELLLYSIGWSTQRWLTQQEEPEGIERDGIIVTPDALNGCPWELKATYQSNSKPIIENIHWIRQIMSQCYVTDTTEAYLSRFEILGDYRLVYLPKGFKDWDIFDQAEYKAAHPRPTLSAWKLQFIQEELDKHWDWMKERKRLYETLLEQLCRGRDSEGYAYELLPPVLALASGMGWECGYCLAKGKECNGNKD